MPTTTSRGSASPARCAIRPSTIRSCRASAIAWMAGRTATSTSARSSRCRRRCRPTRRRSTTVWGPGKYDPRFNIDGKSTPLVLPPAYGLAQRQERDLHGRGTDLVLERLRRGDADGRPGQFLRSAAGHRRHALAGPGRPRSCPRCAPTSTACRRRRRRPEASMRAAAERGRAVFGRALHELPRGRRPAPTTTAASCTRRRRPAWTAPTPRARRTRRTARRRCAALWQHPPYFHDGSAATLADVVAHYNRVRKLGLTASSSAIWSST